MSLGIAVPRHRALTPKLNNSIQKQLQFAVKSLKLSTISLLRQKTQDKIIYYVAKSGRRLYLPGKCDRVFNFLNSTHTQKLDTFGVVQQKMSQFYLHKFFEGYFLQSDKFSFIRIIYLVKFSITKQTFQFSGNGSNLIHNIMSYDTESIISIPSKIVINPVWSSELWSNLN